MRKGPTEPKQVYEQHVFLCQNVRPDDHPRGCCSARGSVELLKYMTSQARKLGIKDARINPSGCLERCEMGPAMVIYPEGAWYTFKTKEDIDEILQSHLIEGKPVKRLLLENTDRLPKDREARLAQAGMSAAE
ncbi:MAG TPA: (2Fe-2S) ferredoxin domain-containing protein [Alphaproteobacteria bacterium]|nr:(2Fe-2S) ferredoxin domain-containing protein [Alphaproteobacteria bacterium]